LVHDSVSWSKYIWREPIPMSVCYKIEARRRSLTVFGQPKWPLTHMCTCVISSLSNVNVMSLSTNSPAVTCDTLPVLLLVIYLCCHFIYNLFVLHSYKIEASRRSSGWPSRLHKNDVILPPFIFTPRFYL